MSKSTNHHIISAAVQSGNFVLAAKSCIKMAEQTKEDPELWLMAAQLSDHAGLRDHAAKSYAVVARLYAKTGQSDQAMRMFQHYADHHPASDERQLCRCLFNACTTCQPSVCKGDEDPLCDILRNHPFWAGQSMSVIHRLLKECRVRCYEKGQQLVRAGDVAECMFLVATGSLHPYIDCQGRQQQGANIGRSNICGEIALYLRTHQRTCDLYAAEDSTVVEIPYTMVHQLMRQDAGFRRYINKRFKRHLLLDMLLHIPWFSDLEREALPMVAKELRLMSCPAGATLFAQGEKETLGMYIVKSGWMSINYCWHGREYYLCTLKPGDVCGELGLLQNCRQVTVRAVVDCELLHWEEQAFRQAYKSHYSIRDGCKASFTRYRKAMENIRSKANNPLVQLSRVEHDELLRGMSCQRLLESSEWAL